MRHLALLGLVLAAAAADGQGVVAIHPPNPTSVDSIVVDVGKPDQTIYLKSVVVVGDRIEITFSGYATTPAFGVDPVPIGRLPAGNYIIVVTFIYEDVFGNPDLVLTRPGVPLVVSEGAAVPTLETWGLLALIFALSSASVFVLKR